MLGEKPLMWLKELEIAIIEKNIESLDLLLQTPVEFAQVDEMKRAQYLLAEASQLLEGLKNETNIKMQLLKKNSDFLKVSQNKTPNRLDIRS